MPSEKTPLKAGKGYSVARKATWLSVSWVMASDVIGTGVLTLPKAAATLGWMGATIVMVLGLLMMMFIAQLMVHVAVDFPEATSMGNAAYWTIGGSFSTEKARNRVKDVVIAIVYGSAFLGQGSYILVLAKSLGGVFHDVHNCLPTWAAISMLMVVPVMQFKSLSDTSNLCFFNLFLILGVIVICTFALLGEGADAADHAPNKVAFNHGSSIGEILSVVGMVVYAYGGNWMYFEIMSEMKEPKDFQKSYCVNGPLQLGFYLIAGLVGYAYRGDQAKAYLLDELEFGTGFRIASLMLFMHVLITYAIKSTVLTRHLYQKMEQDPAYEKSIWLVLTVLLMIGGSILALSMPFFGEMLGLLGCLLGAPICFFLPITLYICGKYHRDELSSIPLWYWPMMAVLLVYGALSFSVGTYTSLMQINLDWASLGAPFSCHCEDMWSTCACSANRLSGVCPASLDSGNLVR
jgi:amino acid permease